MCLPCLVPNIVINMPISFSINILIVFIINILLLHPIAHTYQQSLHNQYSQFIVDLIMIIVTINPNQFSQSTPLTIITSRCMAPIQNNIIDHCHNQSDSIFTINTTHFQVHGSYWEQWGQPDFHTGAKTLLSFLCILMKVHLVYVIFNDKIQ